MVKYQLIEKNINEQQDNLFVGNVVNRYFFRGDEEKCYKIDAHIDHMLSNQINEMEVWLAHRETNVPYFYCKFFGEVGERFEDICSKSCKGYEAKNGKSGVCKNYGHTYEQTDRCFTLILLDKLVL